MRNLYLTVNFRMRQEALGMNGGAGSCLCVINQALLAPGSRLFWSLECSWHIFYKSQPCFLPVANCMHISAPWDLPPFLNQASPASPSPPPNENELTYN